MPNWCNATYVFYGEGETEFANKIKEFTSHNRIENGFGEGWLGNVVDGFGFDWNEMPCRGEITYIGEHEEGIVIDVYSAWAPMTEMWDCILEKYYPEMYYDYIAEEPGMEFFVNTNFEIFPVRYKLEENYEATYYSTEEEKDLINDVNNILSKHGHPTVQTIPEIKKVIGKYNEDMEQAGDYCQMLYLYEFEGE